MLKIIIQTRSRCWLSLQLQVLLLKRIPETLQSLRMLQQKYVFIHLKIECVLKNKVMLLIHHMQLTLWSKLRYPSIKVFAESWTFYTVIMLFGIPCTLWLLQNMGNNIEDNNYSTKSRSFKINRRKKVLFPSFYFIYFLYTRKSDFF